MDDLDDKFIKYAKLDYVDYILSRFKEYGISSNELYLFICYLVLSFQPYSLSILLSQGFHVLIG